MKGDINAIKQTAKLLLRIATFALITQTTLLCNDDFTPNTNHSINIVTENDAYFEPFIKSDGYYTAGHYISYLSPEFAESPLNLLAGFSHFYDKHFTRFQIALKQELHTPNNKYSYDFSAPKDDILFGAGLYANVAFLSRSRDFMEQISFDIGVMGDYALGKQTQNTIHKWTKNREALGWDFGLKNEILLNLHYGLIWRWVFIEDFFDVLPSFQLSLGNARTGINAGARFRLGYGLKNDFGYQKLESIFSQNVVGDGLKIYAMFGINGSIVGRDAFIEGNTAFLTGNKGVQSSVRINHYIYEIEAGFMIGYKYFSIGYLWSNQSKRFKQQNHYHKYGSIRLEIMF